MATEEDEIKLRQITDGLYSSSSNYINAAFDKIDEAVKFLEGFKGINPGLDFSLACIKDYRNEMSHLNRAAKITRNNKIYFNHKMRLIADHAAVIDLKEYKVK